MSVKSLEIGPVFAVKTGRDDVQLDFLASLIVLYRPPALLCTLDIIASTNVSLKSLKYLVYESIKVSRRTKMSKSSINLKKFGINSLFLRPVIL